MYNGVQMGAMGVPYGATNMNQMAMMNGMGAMGPMGMMTGLGNMGNPNYFMFVGNALSLQSRLQTLQPQDLEKIIDANINVTGTQIQAMNTCSLMCTIIWGSIIIIPLCFMCMDWWKRCTYPAFQIDINVYLGLSRLLKAPNIRNLTLTVTDNNFNNAKARVLFNALSESRVKGFTFLNMAGNYDFLQNQFSSFQSNMKPIKSLSHVISDIRWYNEIVLG